MPVPSNHLPNFFVLGVRRGGTASMAHYLEQHPAIRFVEPRDTSFFRKDELYQQGIDYYTRSFNGSTGAAQWIGEASSCYFSSPHIVGPRLRAHFGDAPLKFVVLLREPVSRAWSHYLYRVHNGFEDRAFATALAQECPENPLAEVPYYGEGRYSHLLKEWQSYYPLASFLLLLSEDLAANPLAQVRRVFMWLGVDTTLPINVSERLHCARYSHHPKAVRFINQPPTWVCATAKRLWPDLWQRQRIRRFLRERLQTPYDSLPLLDPVIAAELRHRYRSDVLALSKLLGRYLSHWLPEEELLEMPLAQMAY